MSQVDRPWLHDLLQRLAEGVVAVFGPHCEVVVHDFSDLEHSVIAVVGELTGRRPGAPVPDLSFMPEELVADAPDQLNYRTTRGMRTLHSSTIWIRGDDGILIGAVCINVDYSELLQARDLLNNLATPTRAAADVVVSDTFARDLDELIELSIADFLRQEGVPDVEAMSREDKLRLIEELEKRGLFSIRGAVNRVASLLNVSRASIYNYRSSFQGDEAPVNHSTGEQSDGNAQDFS